MNSVHASLLNETNKSKIDHTIVETNAQTKTQHSNNNKNNKKILEHT